MIAFWICENEFVEIKGIQDKLTELFSKDKNSKISSNIITNDL